MKIIIIVPAFNEASMIRKVLKSLKLELESLGKYEIIVVDDGSSDGTKNKAKEENVTVISHPINRGLGGALGTGLSYAKRKSPDVVITFDADGQHDAKDIKKVIKLIHEKKADIVIGSRTLKKSNGIPIDRKVIIWVSNLITELLFDINTSDSQSGFRAFSKKALDKINIKTQGMEVSSEIFSEIVKHKLDLKEVPIKVVYTDYSRKKGQSNLNALQVLARLLLRLAR